MQGPMAVQSEASFSSDAGIADDGERRQCDCRRVQADMDVPDGFVVVGVPQSSQSHPLDAVSTVGKDQLPQPPEEMGRDATSLPGHSCAEHRPGAGIDFSRGKVSAPAMHAHASAPPDHVVSPPCLPQEASSAQSPNE